MMNSKRKITAALSAAMLILCGCRSGVEYPEGVDTLPSAANTGTGQVITVYDTQSASLPPPPETTASSVSSQTSASETSVPDTELSESGTEETSVCETVTEVSGPQLSDVPDVGISEYYEKTQTTPTYRTQTEFSPSVVAEITTQASAVPAESENTVSAAGTESSVMSASVDILSKNTSVTEKENAELSPYTGKPVITRPYSYYTLDDKYRNLYDKLVSALEDCEKNVSFSTAEQITFDDIFNTYQLIYNDQYTLFYISPTIEYVEDLTSGYVKTMKFSYNYPIDDISQMKEEIETETDKILSRVNGEMSDYEIVKLFHDSIITSCRYSGEAENPNNIYGCLVDKEALCQAYSQTFTYLCHRSGINSLVVLGVANEPHMWNLVEIDGEYYHIDLTWDDPDREANPDSVRYDYFGLTDKRIRELRQVDDYDYEVPAANGTKYQYYYFNGLVAASLDDAKRIISEETIKAARTGSSTVQFMCENAEVFDEITSALFSNTEGNVITVLDSVKDSAVRRYNTESVYHNTNRNTLTVKIFLDYLD